MSSSLTLYDVTIPLLFRSLEQFQTILKKGEQWAKDNNKDPHTLIDARIIDDMLCEDPNATSFVCIATPPTKSKPAATQPKKNHASTNRWREEAQPVEDNEKTFAEFAERIDATIKILRAAKKEKFVVPNQKVTVKSGPVEEAEKEAPRIRPEILFSEFLLPFDDCVCCLAQGRSARGKDGFSLGAGDITTWTL
ncbi:hypothetical protein Slin15195_G098350 [Septoria linicola]|uniref:Uncharacterized protein n=1 Tax=Septoria linicola TaxID=215465 RepID=A0A9Q9B549_9PEZI|nr:hypothetical protein Slin15195_G098350 [Septoria linicola]